VLLHGLMGHSILMRPIRSRLARLGYRVRNWSYWSLPYAIETHANRLRDDVLDWWHSADLDRIHFVGHSMGGIIIRSLLGNAMLPVESMERVGNVVQLVPPNHGSPIATRVYRRGIKFRALRDLADTEGSFVTALPDPSADFCMGILAASRDRIVPLANTPLQQATDYRVIPAGHTTILFRRSTVRLVGHFVQHGSFGG
jgi:triacylglycerol lipase